MSEFIKLTKITVVWDGLEQMTNVFAVRPANIISLTETKVNNVKCTEIEAVCNNGVIRYFVKESVDDILRKIDPLPYTDLENYIFNTHASCNTCKYEKYSNNREPCSSCDYYHDNWESKEDENG